MDEFQIQLNSSVPEEQFVTVIEALAATYGLHVRLRGTLRAYPGSVHWHLGKPSQRCTLEVTLWPAGKRAWFSVQKRRRADWIVNILPQIKMQLEAEIKL